MIKQAWQQLFGKQEPAQMIGHESQLKALAGYLAAGIGAPSVVAQHINARELRQQSIAQL